jgi:hypothetical protein
MKIRNELIQGWLNKLANQTITYALGYVCLSFFARETAFTIAVSLLAIGVLSRLGQEFLRWKSRQAHANTTPS